ncbi:MAG: phosphoglycolate phosphatase [Thermoprotei archaeon]|nr:MAG: phosphoglycolate phosphatase [Thermoprotei archaeon]
MIKAVALDIDGTITNENGVIPPEAWKAIKELEENSVRVILCSGNAACVLLGLRRYSGATGGIVAENGGVVVCNGEERVLSEDTEILREARSVLLKELRGIIVESLQNRYRRVDYAFKLVNESLSRQEVVKRMRKVLLRHGFENLEVLDSGVAFHVHVKGVSKAEGLRVVASCMGIGLNEVAAIGDSETDIPMFSIAGLNIAVGNAVNELKRVAHIVLEEEYYKGFLKAVQIILSCNKLELK